MKRRRVLRAFELALRQEAHNLRGQPELAWQQLHNRLQWDEEAGSLLEPGRRRTRPRGGARPWAWNRVRVRESEAGGGVLTGHAGGVTGCAWSPDGATIVSSGEDGTLRFWDPDSGAEQSRLRAHDGAATACEWSPDGAWVASSGADGAVRTWDPVRGTQRREFRGHAGAVKLFRISPDAASIASSDAEHCLRIWNAATGAEHVIVKFGGGDDLRWGPDGSWVVVVGTSGAKLRSTADGAPRFDLAGSHMLPTCCSVRPGGHWVAFGNMALRSEVWIADTRTGAEVAKFQFSSTWLSACAWSPDGTRLLIGFYNGVLGSLVFGRPPDEVAGLTGRGLPVTACAWNRDGTLVAAGLADGSVLLWTARPGDEGRVLEGHTGEVVACAWSPDGSRLASASKDGTLRVWNPAAPREPAVLPGHQLAVRGCAWNPDGSTFATVGDDGTVRLWDVSGGSERRVIETGRVLISSVTAVAWSPDGTSLLTAGEDGALWVWDTATWQRRHFMVCRDMEAVKAALKRRKRGSSRWEEDDEPDVTKDQGLHDCAWSPDGRLVASAGDDATVQIWDAASGTRRCRLTEHTTAVSAVAWSPDGAWLASAGKYSTVYVRDGTTGAARRTLAGCLPIAWSPVGELLAAAGDRRDGSLRIWSAADGIERCVLAGHSGGIRACAWSRNGSRIASAGDDGMLRIWDPRHRLAPVVLAGPPAVVIACGWSTDGKFFASANADRTLRVWDSANGRALITLPTVGVPTCLAVHPALPLLAAGDEGGTVYLLQLKGIASGRE